MGRVLPAAKIQGIIFSDLGQASTFMALDWVQEGLRRSLGFLPYAATLNVRPSGPEDARLWQAIQKDFAGLALPPVQGGFCSAQLYRVSLTRLGGGYPAMRGAVLVPHVENYPEDKIEIVAPVRLKEALGVKDGDHLVLEFSD